MTNTRFIGKPHTSSLQAVTGFKHLSLLMHVNTRSLSVLPLHRNDQSFSFSDHSRCKKEDRKHHDFLKCSCGFYAYKTEEEAWRHPFTDVFASVALSGTVVIAEHGYRAERQRVTGLNAQCSFFSCFRKADRFSTNGENVMRLSQGFVTLEPYCEICSPSDIQQISFSEVLRKASYEGYPDVVQLS